MFLQFEEKLKKIIPIIASDYHLGQVLCVPSPPLLPSHVLIQHITFYWRPMIEQNNEVGLQVSKWDVIKQMSYLFNIYLYIITSWPLSLDCLKLTIYIFSICVHILIVSNSYFFNLTKLLDFDIFKLSSVSKFVWGKQSPL